jgi:hypothetical protein
MRHHTRVLVTANLTCARLFAADGTATTTTTTLPCSGRHS